MSSSRNRCGICGKTGHNARTCPKAPENEESQSQTESSEEMPARKEPCCSICGRPGHNMRTCGWTRSEKPNESEASVDGDSVTSVSTAAADQMVPLSQPSPEPESKISKVSNPSQNRGVSPILSESMDALAEQNNLFDESLPSINDNPAETQVEPTYDAPRIDGHINPQQQRPIPTPPYFSTNVNQLNAAVEVGTVIRPSTAQVSQTSQPAYGQVRILQRPGRQPAVAPSQLHNAASITENSPTQEPPANSANPGTPGISDPAPAIPSTVSPPNNQMGHDTASSAGAPPPPPRICLLIARMT